MSAPERPARRPQRSETSQSLGDVDAEPVQSRSESPKQPIEPPARPTSRPTRPRREPTSSSESASEVTPELQHDTEQIVSAAQSIKSDTDHVVMTAQEVNQDAETVVADVKGVSTQETAKDAEKVDLPPRIQSIKDDILLQENSESDAAINSELKQKTRQVLDTAAHEIALSKAVQGQVTSNLDDFDFVAAGSESTEANSSVSEPGAQSRPAESKEHASSGALAGNPTDQAKEPQVESKLDESSVQKSSLHESVSNKEPDAERFDVKDKIVAQTELPDKGMGSQEPNEELPEAELEVEPEAHGVKQEVEHESGSEALEAKRKLKSQPEALEAKHEAEPEVVEEKHEAEPETVEPKHKVENVSEPEALDKALEPETELEPLDKDLKTEPAPFDKDLKPESEHPEKEQELEAESNPLDKELEPESEPLDVQPVSTDEPEEAKITETESKVVDKEPESQNESEELDKALKSRVNAKLDEKLAKVKEASSQDQKDAAETLDVEERTSKPEKQGSPDDGVDPKQKDEKSPEPKRATISELAQRFSSAAATKPPPERPVRRPMRKITDDNIEPTKVDKSVFEKETPKVPTKPKPQVSSRIGQLKSSIFADLNAALSKGPPGRRPSKPTSESCNDEGAEPTPVLAEEDADSQLIAMAPTPRARLRGPKRRLPDAAKAKWSTTTSHLWTIEHVPEASEPDDMVSQEAKDNVNHGEDENAASAQFEETNNALQEAEDYADPVEVISKETEGPASEVEPKSKETQHAETKLDEKKRSCDSALKKAEELVDPVEAEEHPPRSHEPALGEAEDFKDLVEASKPSETDSSADMPSPTKGNSEKRDLGLQEDTAPSEAGTSMELETKTLPQESEEPLPIEPLEKQTSEDDKSGDLAPQEAEVSDRSAQEAGVSDRSVKPDNAGLSELPPTKPVSSQLQSDDTTETRPPPARPNSRPKRTGVDELDARSEDLQKRLAAAKEKIRQARERKAAGGETKE
ncbi:hypothetical protein B9G98_00274 [Wickerhamiella sorbophila]|uniref:Uncharacterized protein n=1 Tax=Wickerhamiella sorbophila TaxID=45607 RepID=A0A2T0FCB7_9ASCO|nr:hypothetical protein B9G98_00274 [Wickerhamiella sorbophila]PRT52654.1 hypothetical protein B9G98_00274 [Wickerhamiella sorbophila]